MGSNEHQSDIPRRVAEKLRAIRRRAIALTFIEGLARALAVLLATMLLAMAIDWAVGWFDTRARYVVTLVALAAAASALFFWCIRPLARRRSIVATAQEVDETMPQLEERWSTVAELSQSTDAPEVRGSEAMIQKVAAEAELASADIQPQSVVSAQPAWRAARWLAAAAAVLLVFLAVGFTQARVLLARFWMPGRNISLTQVAAAPADVWVPKGEALTLNASLRGRLPKNGARLFVRSAGGPPREFAMAAKTGASTEFQHSFHEVGDSFEYRVRAGDGQTPWHRITAVERPNISAVRLVVTPPAYSRLPRDEKASLPRAVRVLQGSDVEVSFKSDQPLDKMVLDFGGGRSAQLSADPDQWYHFRARPTNDLAFAAAAINRFKLDNKTKPSCRISVYEDLPPNVKVLEPSDNLAVLPGEKVNVAFEASDDFGIARAEVIVATTKADGATNLITIPVDVRDGEGKRELRRTVPLDTKALGLKNGDQLSYVVQVTDTKQTVAQGAGSMSESTGEQRGGEKPGQAPEADRERTLAGQPSTNPKPARAGDEPKRDSSTAAKDSAERDLEKSTASAKAGPGQPPEPKVASASSRPPNEMAMRTLDAGQSAACQPRNILVDEWAGTFEGDRRNKLELAIDPVLKRLDELLARAQKQTDPITRAGSVQRDDAPRIAMAQTNLVAAQRQITELKRKTSGTPYAFIGLQLQNIGAAHISPAQSNLLAVSFESANATDDLAAVNSASFHIGRAREMLAALTKTYDTVKRDQKIADAMQKLDKMYQIFLEDTQALLGSKKGPINAFDRKVAEVDEQFVEKLKELLEEKKKIMAELARLLAEDPRMMRRYMAMLELQGTSYRDQMTLLAERQKRLQEQVAQWNAAAEAQRPALLEALRNDYANDQLSLVEAATQLHENFETWLPLDIRPDDPLVKPMREQTENIVRATADHVRAMASATNSAAGQRALTELRLLREALPQLSVIGTTNRAKLSTHIANRMQEVDALITAQSGALKIAECLKNGDFAQAAEVTQHALAQDTQTLHEKLVATEAQVARMSEEIANTAAALNKMVKGDVIWPQTVAADQLALRDTRQAEEVERQIVPAFARAEETFDKLMELIIAKLDGAPPPESVGSAPNVESLLAMLENEMKAAEGLGIPCRPLNVSLIRDWMRPGSSPGQGMGMAQAQAAQAQAQAAKAEAERLEKQARESARQAMADARKASPPPVASGEVKSRGEAWNKLASRLQKDLLQGRDNTPPEQYRAAIENYFRVISETGETGEK